MNHSARSPDCRQLGGLSAHGLASGGGVAGGAGPRLRAASRPFLAVISNGNRSGKDRGSLCTSPCIQRSTITPAAWRARRFLLLPKCSEVGTALFLMVGLPGAGKTTRTRELAGMGGRAMAATDRRLTGALVDEPFRELA